MEEVDISLRDGRSVHLREARAADEEEFLQGFERMSEDARYMRWMRVVREPNVAGVRRGLALFPDAAIGLAATVPAADGIDIVGSAVAVFDDKRTGCEFAITVDAAFGGTGLGTALMTALIAEARRRGLEEMEGSVLSENRAMLGLAKRLGFSTAYAPGDASVRICRLALVTH